MEESIIHDRVPVMASFYSNPRENDTINTIDIYRYFTISKNSHSSLFHLLKFIFHYNFFFSNENIYIRDFTAGVNDT